jgi:hypothetical protein
MLSAKGKLINASATGALVISETPPPLDQWLLLRLERPVRTDWYTARVVRHGDRNDVGLNFAASDPYAFILAGTMGIDMEHALIDIPDEQRFSTAGD